MDKDAFDNIQFFLREFQCPALLMTKKGKDRGLALWRYLYDTEKKLREILIQRKSIMTPKEYEEFKKVWDGEDATITMVK